MKKYDVVIIWWWPAWSSLATLLAKKKKKVLVIEKSSFPKHSVWESLLPDTTNRFLKILWVKEAVDKAWFARKYWGTYIWGKTKKPWHLIFDRNLDEKIHLKQNISKEETTEILNSDAMHSYQVNRYIFDKILVDRAKELGVEFIENTKVIDLIYEWNKIIWVKDQYSEEYYGELIVDAWWREWFIRNKLWISEKNEDLWFFSLYTYFKDCDFYDEFFSKYTQLIISIDIWWIWFIHIWWWIVSVWIVTNDKEFTKDVFMQKLKENKYVSDSIKSAMQCDHLWEDTDKIYSISNWSNISKKMYWENFVLIWDAWGFVDPILSWWMSFAINTAFAAYVYIMKYFELWNINVFSGYEKMVFRDIDDYMTIAKFWYWNNKVLDSYFWLAKSKLWLDISNKFNRLAFIYLSSWAHYSDRNLKLYDWEIEVSEDLFGWHEKIRAENLIQFNK